mgnify:CR=1 FL=1
MGKYLCVGLAKQIIARAEDEKMAEELTKDFFSKVERNLYEVEYEINKRDDTRYLIFNLKDDMIYNHAMDLIIEQHEKYIKSPSSEEAIQRFKEIKDKNKKEFMSIINTINEPYMSNFKLGWFGFDIAFLFEKRVDAYITEFLEFHCSEKTYMEEYYSFFRYMRNILINSTKNPLRTALAVSL